MSVELHKQRLMLPNAVRNCIEGGTMPQFSISKTSHKYRIVGMTAQRPALPLSIWAAWCEAALFGLPAGALLALPAALRAGGSFLNGFIVWLAACGLFGLATTLSVGLLRSGRPLPSFSSFIPLGLVIAAGPLAFLGKILHATTHHRPLGAATFSMSSLGIIAGALAFAARTRRLLHSRNPSMQLAGRVYLCLGVLLSLALGLGRFVALLAAAHSSPGYLAAVLDGLLGLCLSLVGGFARFTPKVERLAKHAGPLAFAVCVLVLLVAFKSPNMSNQLAHCSALWYVLRPL